MSAALDALGRKWYIAVVVFVIGAGVAAALFARNSAGLIRYVATAQMRIANPAGSVQLPCSPQAAAAIAKYVPPVSETRVSINPARFTAELPAAGVMTLHYLSADAQSASDGVNAVANGLVAFCARRTADVTAAAQKALSVERARLAASLAPLDAQVGASKERTSLVAQRDELQMKLIGLQAAAKNAQAQLDAAEPVARNEIEQADPAFVALKKRLDTDLDTYTSVASAYRSTYARVIGLKNRVAIDRQQLDARRAELEEQPLELSATYRTALAAANDAQSAADVVQMQIDDLNARIAQADVVIGKSGSGSSASRSQDALAKAYQNVTAADESLRAQRAQISAGGPVELLTSSSVEQTVKTGVLAAALLSLVVALLFLLFGIILATLIGLLDRRLLTVPQFTKLYGKPVIATLLPKR